jgi:hypothetical protein
MHTINGISLSASFGHLPAQIGDKANKKKKDGCHQGRQKGSPMCPDRQIKNRNQPWVTAGCAKDLG